MDSRARRSSVSGSDSEIAGLRDCRIAGRKTFLQFPSAILQSSLPAILSLEPECEDRVATRDDDPLFPPGEERHRGTADRGARLKLPERFASLRVYRVEVPFVRSTEHETAGGRHHAGPRRRRQLEVPHRLAALHVDGAHRAPGFFVETLLAAAGEVGAGPVLD